MKKLLLAIIFAAVLAIALFKGLIWYQVYSQLEQVKEQVSQHAMIKYGWISSSFDGRVGVADIEITPYLLKGVITVDEVSLTLKDAWSLFKLQETFDRGQWPDQLSVGVTNLSVPVDSDVAGFYDSLSDRNVDAASDANFNPFGIYACGDTKVVSGKELKAMGYSQLSLSSEFRYQFSPNNRTLQVSAVVDSDSLGRSDFVVDLGLRDAQLSEMLVLSAVPDINTAKWSFNDGGYFRRLSFFCAKKAGVDRIQYVEEAAQEWDADLQDHGIIVNRLLVDAYRRYILDGGLLSMSIQPEVGIDYSVLPLFSMNDLMAMFNLKIMLNGDALSDLSVVVDRAEKATLLSDDAEPGSQPKPGAESKFDTGVSQQATQSVNLGPVKQYVEITIEELEGHIRHKVFIELDTGKQIEGTVVSVDESLIEVERNMGGGVVSYPLRKGSITLVKVWK